MNGEGYKDPTADRAIREASRPPEEITWLVKLFRELAGKLGYDITGRIHFKDKENGKIWT